MVEGDEHARSPDWPAHPYHCRLFRSEARIRRRITEIRAISLAPDHCAPSHTCSWNKRFGFFPTIQPVILLILRQVSPVLNPQYRSGRFINYPKLTFYKSIS
jgi:hypothetical protein